MITIVIPTRNRAYTLKKVLESYYQQQHVDQIVIVNDSSSDDTDETVKKIAAKYPNIETTVVRNEKQMGASYTRNKGVSAARNEFVLFGEDDAFLAKDYTGVLLPKLQSGENNVGIVSGRLINLFPGEDPEEAIERFGNGDPRETKTFSKARFSHLPDAYYENDIYLPLTHAMILTYRNLLEKYPYDTNYSKGNAFREESDFQVNAYVNGYTILVSNDTHSMHLHPQDVRVGGHRTPILKSIWCKIYYTNYFFKKYYSQLRIKMRLPFPRWVAVMVYTLTQINELAIAVGHYIRKKVRRAKSKILTVFWRKRNEVEN